MRLKRRLSLDELSRRSGVSKGMLVEIEKGGANPSIATLCKVAVPLGVSVAELVEVGEGAAGRVVSPEEAAVLWRGPQGGSATLLAGTSGTEMIELWSWVLHPGERHDSPAHPRGTVELIHVTEGCLAVELEGRPLEVGTGASALLRTDRDHAYAALGEGQVRFVMAVAEWNAPASGAPGA
ncbi:helix-turn-helix domain-containing protein [Arenibaculum pallidiluteum]|uniref:helix-turn-helix domain-containing protein n=1 Tax=Arenibaculum pallidiluteum TaxID=2812559 RepID=UPI001A973A90|nr:XRE family transcriptional regulator [Arenibaculum pallidiluteum]